MSMLTVPHGCLVVRLSGQVDACLIQAVNIKMKPINCTIFTFIDLKANMQNCLISWDEKTYGIILCKLCCGKKKEIVIIDFKTWTISIVSVIKRRHR